MYSSINKKSIYANWLHLAIQREISTDIFAMYMETKDMCRRYQTKFWKNKNIVSLLREIRVNNEEWYKKEIGDQCLSVNTPTGKIDWRNKDARWKKTRNQENDRGGTPIGNLRWREKGFRKQEVTS